MRSESEVAPHAPGPEPRPSWTHPLAPLLAARTAVPADFDVIVIGSGAGGAPLAWKLGRSGLRVAVIEAGELMVPEPPPVIVEKHFLCQGVVGSVSGGGLAVVLAGSAVGGTTAVNSGTCLRPLQARLSQWDETAGTDFSAGRLEPYLAAAEAQLRVAVPPRELLSKSADVMEAGLRALGREGAFVLPRAAPGCAGSGLCCFGCPRRAKQGTDLAYLPEAVAAGVCLLPRTRATRIVEHAYGVSVQIRDAFMTRTLSARHCVISAGALGTPHLVRVNRLGTRWRVAGYRLKIHPAAKVFGYFPGLRHGPGGVPQGLGYRPPELPRIALEGIHTPRSAVGSMLTLAGSRLGWWMERFDDLASFGVMLQERGLGRVLHVAGRPLLDYALHPEDASDLGAAFLLVAESFLAAGAERVLLPLADLPNEVSSLEQLRRLKPRDFTPRNLSVAGFHPQGTAGIGRVVDPELRVIGCSRVSVCDASVLPHSPGVNPQVSVQALSLRLAERLLAEVPGG